MANGLITIAASIVGIFKVHDGRLEKDDEKKMIKSVVPSVLMPYMRAAVSGYCAAAGFGTVTIPLVNMVEMSATALNDVEIQEVD